MKKKVWWIILLIVLAVVAVLAVNLRKRYLVAGILDDYENARNYWHTSLLEPLPVSIDVAHLEDGIYPVSFHPDSARRTENGIELEFGIYSHDLYDVVELHLLQAGDSIRHQGKTLRVDSIAEKNGVYLINGGLEMGGIDLHSNGGGTYQSLGYDDATTYSFHGRTMLCLPDTMGLTDKGNVEQSMEGVKVAPSELFDYLKNVHYGYYNEHNTRIRIEDGKIVEFYREYRP